MSTDGVQKHPEAPPVAETKARIAAEDKAANEAVGNWLYLERMTLRLSMEVVAAALGIDRKTYARYEKGEIALAPTHVRALYRSFGIEPEGFMDIIAGVLGGDEPA